VSTKTSASTKAHNLVSHEACFTECMVASLA
jgi:hypothetical protein